MSILTHGERATVFRPGSSWIQAAVRHVVELGRYKTACCAVALHTLTKVVCYTLGHSL